MLTIPYSQNPEDFYFDIINEPNKTSMVIFGEKSDMWTSRTIDLLIENDIPVFLLPWSNVKNLRLQFCLVSYPVIQLWHDRELLRESVGFNPDSLKSMANQYFKNKNAKAF